VFCNKTLGFLSGLWDYIQNSTNFITSLTFLPSYLTNHSAAIIVSVNFFS